MRRLTPVLAAIASGSLIGLSGGPALAQETLTFNSAYFFNCQTSVIQGEAGVEGDISLASSMLPCEVILSTGGMGSARGHASTGREFAHAGALANSSPGFMGEPGPLMHFGTTAEAIYTVGFELFQELPFTPLTLPVEVKASATFSCGGLCEPEARLSVKYKNVEQLPLPREARVEEHFPLLPDPAKFSIFLNEAAVVRLWAHCRVVAVAPTYSTSICTTNSDPVWSFDQEAFDAEWGAASFPLDEYVDFAYAIPEPGRAVQFAVGALLLIGAAALRKPGR